MISGACEILNSEVGMGTGQFEETNTNSLPPCNYQTTFIHTYMPTIKIESGGGRKGTVI